LKVGSNSFALHKISLSVGDESTETGARSTVPLDGPPRILGRILNPEKRMKSNPRIYVPELVIHTNDEHV
jgi:hypothetical protein